MRTTLDLPDDTFRQLKAQAALRGYKLKELVAQFIESGLKSNTAQPDQASPSSPLPAAIERTNYPIPIAREADGSVTPYLRNAQLYAILEEEDIAQYQHVVGEESKR